jgi:5'-nucleotidase / UDP-sugar diphosphatase
MRRILLILTLLISALSLTAQTEKKITILHTNDLHSRLIGYTPESAYSPLTMNDDKTVGGFARIAAIIKNEKEHNKGTTLVLDAGDFMTGTLFPSIETKTGFQLRLMKEMGYDVVGIGNHEYEFGPGWLASVIDKSHQNGAIPQLLIGNVKFDNKNNADDGLEKLFADKLIARKTVLTRDGIRIGIFSILGKDAVNVAPKAVPVTFEKQSSFAKKMVKELQKENCDIIICISHSGITKEKNGGWGGEDVELARSVKGIDLIIGGHTHTKLDKPLIVNGIPIVQAGEFGQFVGCLSLSWSPGKISVENYRLITVDDRIAGDEHINQMIEEQKEKINLEILKPLGMDYSQPVVETSFTIEGNDGGDYINSNLGPLIADAIRYYVNKHSSKGTDISMVAAGMIFDKIMPGIQSVPDIFRVMPLGSGKDEIPGYALSRLFVTGNELKSILEILQVASRSKPSNYCYYSGLRVIYDPGRGLFRKIKKIGVVHDDGTVASIDFSKKNKSLYSITADSYMLEFIGIIKKMSFGLINVVPKDAEGVRVKDMKTLVIDMDETREGVTEGKEWLALVEFLSSMKDTNGDGIPDVDKKYASAVRCFFNVKTDDRLKN